MRDTEINTIEFICEKVNYYQLTFDDGFVGSRAFTSAI